MLTDEDKKQIRKESERGVIAVFIITAIVIFIAIFLVVTLSVNVLELWGVI